MVLHLGGDVVVPIKDIIAIFDFDTAEASEINKEFIDIAREEGFIRKVSDDDPKTFVLVESRNKTMMYMSPISSSTLLKRSGFVEGISTIKTEWN